MDKLDIVLDGLMKKRNISKDLGWKVEGTRLPPSLELKTQDCPRCQGAGWIIVGMVETRPRHYENKLERCACKTDEDRRKRFAFLQNMDGLTEQERAKSFGSIEDNYEPGVVQRLQLASSEGRGLVTLTGSFGVGKTTLLMCAVNQGRESGKLALYTTLTDLLKYLRSTFDRDSEVSYDKYWQALIDCDILALDELDEPRATDWVLEIFMRLVDERWRRMDERLTICALNGRIHSLPGKIQSRLSDGRAQVIAIGGHDMRPSNYWNN